MKQRLWLLLLMCLPVLSAQRGLSAVDDDNARQVFEDTYNMVFGPKGCTLTYDVNLIGLYKSNGTIWYKGKKNKFIDAKVTSWNDGQTVYMVHKKKKVVDIYDANSEKVNKYTSKFKFSFDDFKYSIKQSGDHMVLTLKQKKGARGTVKEAQVVLDAKTRAPLMARIKVMLFWANIKISNFKAGDIADDVFTFPRSQYGEGYKYVDNRKK